MLYDRSLLAFFPGLKGCKDALQHIPELSAYLPVFETYLFCRLCGSGVVNGVWIDQYVVQSSKVSLKSVTCQIVDPGQEILS